jgi:stage IV sporulation protein FB
MGWESRNYASSDGPSGFRAAIRRVFQGDFFSWGIRLYRAWGIEVRLHLLFILIVIGEMIQALVQSKWSWEYRAITLGSLFLLVLLHEYGHCIACRRVGGTADRIVLWPLGGLARCASPHHWRADLITTIGGPAVNLVLMPVFAVLLLAVGLPWRSVIFNPFNAGAAFTGLHLRSGAQPYWLFGLWLMHATNAGLFFFNVLLPMYPMDSGRIVHALLWRRLGYRRATDIITKMGLGVAVILLVLGTTFEGGGRFVSLALFGGLCCWQERRQMQMLEGDPALVGYDFDRGYGGMPDTEERESPRAARAREKQRQKEDADQAELDRILAKIATSGMSSLSRGEKRWLEQASARKRRG